MSVNGSRHMDMSKANSGESSRCRPERASGEGTPRPSPQLDGTAGGAQRRYVSYGLATAAGRRGATWQDAAVAAPRFAPLLPPFDYFAVYDGHFGGEVAAHLRARLHAAVGDEMARDLWRREGMQLGGGVARWWERVMRDAFRAVDAEVVRSGTCAGGLVGATALAAVVAERYFVLAHCGNSKAVVSRGGAALQLTFEHRPNRPDEKRRIEVAGGRVPDFSGLVDNILPTSRAFGSSLYKRYVIAEPEVAAVNRTPLDEFLVLATDGLWDFVTPNMACHLVRQGLCIAAAAAMADAPAATAVANQLAQFAAQVGSGDSISIVIVVLRNFWAPQDGI